MHAALNLVHVASAVGGLRARMTGYGNILAGLVAVAVSGMALGG